MASGREAGKRPLSTDKGLLFAPLSRQETGTLLQPSNQADMPALTPCKSVQGHSDSLPSLPFYTTHTYGYKSQARALHVQGGPGLLRWCCGEGLRRHGDLDRVVQVPAAAQQPAGRGQLDPASIITGTGVSGRHRQRAGVSRVQASVRGRCRWGAGNSRAGGICSGGAACAHAYATTHPRANAYTRVYVLHNTKAHYTLQIRTSAQAHKGCLYTRQIGLRLRLIDHEAIHIYRPVVRDQPLHCAVLKRCGLPRLFRTAGAGGRPGRGGKG